MRRTLDDLRNGMGGLECGDDTLKLRDFEKGFERFIIGGVGVFSAFLIAQPCVLGAYGGVVKAGGHKCLEIKGQFTVKGLKPPADFPRNLRITKSEMAGRMHSKIPVDTTLPEVENKMVVTMIMEVRSRRGQVAMKISRRAETHTKMELLKTKR